MSVKITEELELVSIVWKLKEVCELVIVETRQFSILVFFLPIFKCLC